MHIPGFNEAAVLHFGQKAVGKGNMKRERALSWNKQGPKFIIDANLTKWFLYCRPVGL